jgi:AbrB family looped-hinge helix DNA binding protein
MRVRSRIEKVRSVNMERVAKITSKGQVTVPQEFRKEMGVAAGDSLVFQKQGNKIVISPRRRGSVFEEFRGTGTPGIGQGKKAVLRWVRDVRGEL